MTVGTHGRASHGHEVTILQELLGNIKQGLSGIDLGVREIEFSA